MTRVRWTSRSSEDLVRIVDLIREDNPAAAQRVARRIYTSIAELRRFPLRGRLGFASDTRELVFPPWPYIVVYEIVDEQVNVLRIRHASRDWP